MTDDDDSLAQARRGWDSDFVRFAATPSGAIVGKLRAFPADASREQVRAWDDSIPRLQAEVAEVREIRQEAARYTAILDTSFLWRHGVPTQSFSCGKAW